MFVITPLFTILLRSHARLRIICRLTPDLSAPSIADADLLTELRTESGRIFCDPNTSGRFMFHTHRTLDVRCLLFARTCRDARYQNIPTVIYHEIPRYSVALSISWKNFFAIDFLHVSPTLEATSIKQGRRRQVYDVAAKIIDLSLLYKEH